MGVILTSNDWQDDLWVLREYRNQGVGEQLLYHGETEITERGYQMARLRVIKSNAKAISFYEKHGWHKVMEFQHETLQIQMLEMAK